MAIRLPYFPLLWLMLLPAIPAPGQQTPPPATPPPLALSAKPVKPKAEIVYHDKVWDRAEHSAFTDLLHFHDRWFLAFREAATHVSADGAIRILSSTDFERWQETARVTTPPTMPGDLRDPKLCETPDGRLMLTTALRREPPATPVFQTYAWYSRTGRDWSAPEPIGDENVWLWRVQWRHGKALALGYGTSEPQHFLRAYLSMGDGRPFQTLNPFVLNTDYPNETSVLFQQDETALCLLRRDQGTKTALLGRSRPPYRAWTWTDLGVRIGGPHMTRVGDGRIVAAVRLYDGKTRTSLCWLDPESNTLTEFLALPSGGDTSYAGLGFRDGLLYVSYYSSHEGHTAIYVAKVRLPAR